MTSGGDARPSNGAGLSLAPWYSTYYPGKSAPPLHLLVIQATTFCNIDCRYCYLPDRDKKRSFDLRLLPVVFDRLHEAKLLGRRLTVLWHAGEPLVLPVEYYRKAFAIASRSLDSIPFVFNFQTNATLVSDEYCAFFRESEAEIGVSIDGPEFITGKWRVSRSGRSMYSSIMRGIDLLRHREVPFHAIAVVTADSLDHADEVYEFFRDLGAQQVGFNIEEIEGVHARSTLSRSPDVIDRYRAFMRRLFDRSRQERPSIRFREFHQLERSIRHGNTVTSSLCNPFSIMTVNVDGDFSTYSPELAHNRSFVFGNVQRDAIADAAASAHFMHSMELVRQGRIACEKTCDYYAVCGGGCPSNKHYENGTVTSTETMNCRFTKQALTDIVLDALEDEYGLT